MNKLSSLALGAVVAFATIGLAHAADSAAVGTWKLSTGVADAPCMVTLAADPAVSDAGTITSTGDCNGTTVGRWHQANGLQLLSNNGTLVAWLRPKGDVYEGTRLSDGRKVALSH